MKLDKNIYYLLIFIICYGCGDRISENIKERSSENSRTIISDTIVLSDKRLVEIIKKLTPSTFSDCNIEIKSRTKMNKRIFFIRYEMSDGVSLTNYLMTFVDRNYKDLEILDHNSDHDLLSANYEYRELTHSENDNFVIANYKQSVLDKNMLSKDTNFLKEGFDFENVEIKTDTTIIKLTITTDGLIKRDTINRSISRLR